MFSPVYFALVAFGFSAVLGDDSALCRTWRNLEQSLKNEDFIVSCSADKNCYGLNCSGSAHGYNIQSRIELHACDNPPNIEFQVDVPRLNINNFQTKVYHNDSIPLSKNLKLEFEVERKNAELVVGLFVHFESNGSFPLLRIPMRISVISPTKFPVDCSVNEETSEKSSSVSKSISELSSPATVSFLISTQDKNEGYSNCSITNSSCNEDEICKQISKGKPDGICVCISNYTRNEDGKCIHHQPPTESSSVSLLLTAILVPIFVILLIVAAVYASIRFRVFQHLRRRLRVQVYEHVLLGEDEDEDLENPVA